MSQVVTTVLNDGDRYAVVHVAIQGDAAGDLAGEVIVDPASTFSKALPNVPSLTITKLWYDLTDFNGRLDYEFLPDNTPVWNMSSGFSSTMDFTEFQGIKDKSPADGTGKILLSTSGLLAGGYGSIIIKLRKD